MSEENKELIINSESYKKLSEIYQKAVLEFIDEFYSDFEIDEGIIERVCNNIYDLTVYIGDNDDFIEEYIADLLHNIKDEFTKNRLQDIISKTLVADFLSNYYTFTTNFVFTNDIF